MPILSNLTPATQPPKSAQVIFCRFLMALADFFFFYLQTFFTFLLNREELLGKIGVADVMADFFFFWADFGG